jgi:HEAT repeat protein
MKRSIFFIMFLNGLSMVGLATRSLSETTVYSSETEKQKKIQEFNQVIQRIELDGSVKEFNAIRALKGEDSKSRLDALISLSLMSNLSPSVLPVLLPLLKDPSPSIRSLVKETLDKVRNPSGSAIPILLPLIADQDAEVRSTIVNVLGKMRKAASSVVPAIIPLLKDQDARVRSSAVEALGQMGESAKSAIPDLTPLLKDQDLGVRFKAMTALAKLELYP